MLGLAEQLDCGLVAADLQLFSPGPALGAPALCVAASIVLPNQSTLLCLCWHQSLLSSSHEDK
eukprot:3521589-Amphidinium_carterae.1